MLRDATDLAVGERTETASIATEATWLSPARDIVEPLTGWAGAVGEDVAEVAVATCAARLDAANLGVVHGSAEGRPSSSRIEFGVTVEERLVADDALVGAVIFGVVVFAAECPLGPTILGDLELLGGEPVAKLITVEGLFRGVVFYGCLRPIEMLE